MACANTWCDDQEVPACPDCGRCHLCHDLEGYGGCKEHLGYTPLDDPAFDFENRDGRDDLRKATCTKCGGDTWRVAPGSFRVVIQCVTCQYVIQIYKE